MNIEIANRLQKLRKEKGYSQEELADALGISRQAVSKWERAEASPDTDNLICLAKLYNVSLDSLLDTDETIEEIKEEQKEKAEEAKVETEKSEDTGDKFLRDDEGDFVHIGKDGVHIKDKDGSEVHIGRGGIRGVDKNGRHFVRRKSKFKVSSYISGILMLCAVVAYLLLGFLGDWFGQAWVIFFLPIILGSIVHAIETKRFSAFNMPVLCTFIFLFLGVVYPGIWHPTWVVFLLIPIYYSVFAPFDHKRGCCDEHIEYVDEPVVDEVDADGDDD